MLFTQIYAKLCKFKHKCADLWGFIVVELIDQSKLYAFQFGPCLNVNWREKVSLITRPNSIRSPEPRGFIWVHAQALLWVGSDLHIQAPMWIAFIYLLHMNWELVVLEAVLSRWALTCDLALNIWTLLDLFYAGLHSHLLNVSVKTLREFRDGLYRFPISQSEAYPRFLAKEAAQSGTQSDRDVSWLSNRCLPQVLRGF